MKTTVNTEAKIPKKLFDALCLFETFCVVFGITETNENDVKAFITKHFSEDLAKKFKKEFLY